MASVYDISVKSITGEELPLAQYGGKVIHSCLEMRALSLGRLLGISKNS